VYTPSDVQLERFVKRNKYSEEESLKRIATQMPIEAKKEKATWIIDNSKNLKHLQQEVEDFVGIIKDKYL
jgi:dephospho-CoA kinase